MKLPHVDASRLLRPPLSARIKAMILAATITISLVVALVISMQHTSDARHTQRLKDQAATDRVLADLKSANARIDDLIDAVRVLALQNKSNVAELACIIVSQTPNSPARPIIGQFRKKYGCPPFNPKATGLPGAQGAPGGSGVRTPGPEPPSSPATRTPAPRPTPSPTPTPSRTCLILPTLCLPTGLPLPPLPVGTLPFPIGG